MSLFLTLERITDGCRTIGTYTRFAVGIPNLVNGCTPDARLRNDLGQGTAG
jgi:hypothetical protein